MLKRILILIFLNAFSCSYALVGSPFQTYRDLSIDGKRVLYHSSSSKNKREFWMKPKDGIDEPVNGSGNESWKKKALRLHEKDAAEVLRLNTHFYNTMSERDMGLMSKIWHNDDIVQCLHPGLPLIQGYDSIMKVFHKMFNSNETKQHSIVFSPKKVKVHVRGNSAWVSCIEDALVVAHGSHLRYKMCATNIFRKVGKCWFMIHHHTSPFPIASTAAPTSYSSNGAGMMSIGNILLSKLGSNSTNGPKIIHLKPREGVQEQIIYNFNDQKDDENKNDTLNPLSGVGNGSSLRIISNIGNIKKSGDNVDSMEERIRSSVQDSENDSKKDEKDLTRRTVAAIRDMYQNGRLSKEEKQVLLMDVIRNAASENPSMTEVAYELLLGSTSGLVEESVDEDALNEFVAQCKVFAKEISNSDM